MTSSANRTNANISFRDALLLQNSNQMAPSAETAILCFQALLRSPAASHQQILSKTIAPQAELASFQNLSQVSISETILKLLLQQDQRPPANAEGLNMMMRLNNGVPSALQPPQTKDPFAPTLLSRMSEELQNANCVLGLQNALASAIASLVPMLVSNMTSPASSICSSGSTTGSLVGTSYPHMMDSYPHMVDSRIAQSTDPFRSKPCLEGKRPAETVTTQEQEQNAAPPMKKAKKSEEHTTVYEYHDEKWNLHFNHLLAYKKINGHCRVPHTYDANPALSHWVKRQRYQHKCKLEGKVWNISESRIQKLNAIGFIWDAQELLWQTRFDELKDYRLQYGDCNVPYNFNENRKLPTWVKCQRRQYKLRQMGKSSNMTKERIKKLQVLGFKWGLRSSALQLSWTIWSGQMNRWSEFPFPSPQRELPLVVDVVAIDSKWSGLLYTYIYIIIIRYFKWHRRQSVANRIKA